MGVSEGVPIINESLPFFGVLVNNKPFMKTLNIQNISILFSRSRMEIKGKKLEYMERGSYKLIIKSPQLHTEKMHRKVDSRER